jgi:hypothetical protein
MTRWHPKRTQSREDKKLLGKARSPAFAEFFSTSIFGGGHRRPFVYS